MLIIHQRKSAGTALISALTRDLGCVDWAVLPERQRRINIFTAVGPALQANLDRFAASRAYLRSVHLHPSASNLAWAEASPHRMVVLLRNPQQSYEALFRHRERSNAQVQVNRAATKANALERLFEFNRNWRTLASCDHLLFVSYEDVVCAYPETLKAITDFWGFDLPAGWQQLGLPKVRYSGIAPAHGDATDLSPTREPDFSVGAADFRPPQWALRKLKEGLDRLWVSEPRDRVLSGSLSET